MRGAVIWFNLEKGYGFIRTEDEERLYVARDGFLRGHVPLERCAGRAVTFDRVGAEDDARAIEVAFIPDDGSPRRARLRSARSGVRI
jgi:cold shock CspA family protein